MAKLDLTVTIKCCGDDNRLESATPELLDELMDGLKDDFVYEGIVETTIEINENATKQHLLFMTN